MAIFWGHFLLLQVTLQLALTLLVTLTWAIMVVSSHHLVTIFMKLGEELALVSFFEAFSMIFY
jgi:hypothetical protein